MPLRLESVEFSAHDKQGQAQGDERHQYRLAEELLDQLNTL